MSECSRIIFARHPVLLVAMSITEFVKATSTLDNAFALGAEA